MEYSVVGIGVCINISLFVMSNQWMMSSQSWSAFSLLLLPPHWLSTAKQRPVHFDKTISTPSSKSFAASEVREPILLVIWRLPDWSRQFLLFEVLNIELKL